jgi:hypothetical protein
MGFFFRRSAKVSRVFLWSTFREERKVTKNFLKLASNFKSRRFRAANAPSGLNVTREYWADSGWHGIIYAHRPCRGDEVRKTLFFRVALNPASMWIFFFFARLPTASAKKFKLNVPAVTLI